MPAWYEIYFEETGETVDWCGVAGYSYLFDDGSQLKFSMVPAWCTNCQEIVGIELIPSLDDLEVDLIEQLDPNSSFNRTIADLNRRREEFVLNELKTPIPAEMLERHQ